MLKQRGETSISDKQESVINKLVNSLDIRTAFFRAENNLKLEKKNGILNKPKTTDENVSSNFDKYFDNEILKELQKKPTNQRTSFRHNPTPNRTPISKMQFSNNCSFKLSQAHKRKLSPIYGDRLSKKIELDVDTVESLFGSDESIELDLTTPSFKPPATNLNQINNIKKESDLNFSIDLFNNQTEEIDAQIQLKTNISSNKLLFFWLDTYEDTLNSNGTIYLFGKMPIIKQSTIKTETTNDSTQQNKTTTTNNTQDAKNQLSFVSVCLIIKNIPRKIYILPRKYKKNKIKRENCMEDELVTMDNVREEIVTIMQKYKIKRYQTKIVKKYYAFDKKIGNNYNKEELIPFESNYLEVKYIIDCNNLNNNQNLPNDLEGEYFSCIFGASTSFTEHFLIESKLKGPCWLLVSSAKRRGADEMGTQMTGSMISWSKIEYIIEDHRTISLYHENVMLENAQIQLPTTPPLTILTLLTRTMLNTKTQEHEIVCACGLVSHKFYLDKSTTPTTTKSQPLYETYFCALTKPSCCTFPYDFQNALKGLQNKFKIEICGSERALLAFLLCKIHSLDIDILIGHDLFGSNFDILLNRCVVKKVPHWSRLGRLKRSNMPSMPSYHQKMSSHANSSTNNIIIQQRIQTVCSGRLLCDIMLSAKELLTKCKSFDLNDLVSHILFKKETNSSIIQRDYDEEKNVANFYNSSEQLLRFLQYSMMDVTYILRIFNDLQCLQLAYQITCIAGNVLSRTLVGGRSERNEYLLLHAFHDKDFILPDKHVINRNANKSRQFNSTTTNNKSVNKSTNSGNKSAQVKVEIKQADEEDEDQLLSNMVINHEEEPDDDLMSTTAANNNNKSKLNSTKPVVTHVAHNGYTGGLVLEPKVGFYDRFILLLDFNSLYPSIIQEFNICFTTVGRPINELAEKDLEQYLENYVKLPGPEEKPGILPLEIRKLVDSRRQVKQLMQDKSLSADLRMQYDIRQKALKLTANSVYGCLGFENSRFYCKPLAALITKNGRNILMKTKELVENKKIEVIYGDTDSIMINTNLNDYDQVIKLGNMIKAEVNKLYKHLEIDIDGVFKSLLLLRKKKYAALTVIGRNPKDQTLQYQQEIKGLDIVRRDWCLLAKQIGERVISEILSGQNYDLVLTNINKILNETAEKIKNNSIDLSLFEISKQLNRNPEDYNDANHQSHVFVALRYNNDINNSKKYKSGNVVSYIICEDGTSNSATQRAYSKSELLKSPDTLKLDTKYYLTQQVHPVVTRLCEPIEGIDAYHIAQSLGLDPTGFRHKNSSSSNSNLTIVPPQLSKQQKKLENFMNALEKFSNCVPFKFTCPNCRTENTWQTPFIKCENSSTKIKIGNISSQIDQIKIKEEQEDEEMNDDITIDESSIIVKPIVKSSNGINNSSSLHSSTYLSNYKCVLESCSNSTCKYKPFTKLAYIKNCLTIQMSKFIKQYYQAWYICEDPMCSYRTKRLSCKFFNGKPQCIECERYTANLEYSESDLYYQMRFFKFIFDSDAFKKYYKNDSMDIANYLNRNKEVSDALNQLRAMVNQKLKMNAFGSVNLTDLFKNFKFYY